MQGQGQGLDLQGQGQRQGLTPLSVNYFTKPTSPIG